MGGGGAAKGILGIREYYIEKAITLRKEEWNVSCQPLGNEEWNRPAEKTAKVKPTQCLQCNGIER